MRSIRTLIALCLVVPSGIAAADDKAAVLNACYQEQDPATAIKLCSEGLELTNLLDSDRANLLTQRGHSYIGLGGAENARADYEAALKIEPSARTYGNRGLLRAETGDLDGARDDYIKALEYDPRAAGVWHNLGMTYIRLAKAPEALDAFDRAIEINPKFPYSRFMRARVRCWIGETGTVYKEMMAARQEGSVPAPQLNQILIGRGLLTQSNTSDQAVGTAISLWIRGGCQ